MLQLIKTILEKFILQIDNGDCDNLDLNKQHLILNFIRAISNPNEKKTKHQAAEFLGVSVATFENYVRRGWIPKGEKIDSELKTLYWELYDLQEFLHSDNSKIK